MFVRVLFLVFMALAFVGTIPGSRMPGGSFFLWLSVLMLYFMVHGVGL